MPALPRLVLALSMDTPGQSTGQNGVVLIVMLRKSGVRVISLAVDRAYNQAAVENFAARLKELGCDLICDYRDDHLGIMAQHKGALMVEGAWYAPCMPSPLVNATIDLRLDRIDMDTYKRRIAERTRYRMRLHEVIRGGEAERYRCPSQGKGATLLCPLRRNSATAARLQSDNGPVPLPLIQVPENPPPVCTNASSTTIPVEVGLKFRQLLQYGSDEWHMAYSHRRNQIEGANRILKNGAQTNVGEADLRRIRGLAKHNIAIAFAIVAANIASIARFIRKRADAEPEPQPRRGRPARVTPPPSGEDAAPLPPLRIAGWQPKRRIA